VAGQVAKEIGSQVAGHLHERIICDPTGHPPQQIVGGDQRNQQDKGEPHRIAAVGRVGKGINQRLDAILGRDRATDRRQHGGHNDGMRYGPPTQIAPDESQWTRCEAAEIIQSDFVHPNTYPYCC
jgi:hypothetical protein